MSHLPFPKRPTALLVFPGLQIFSFGLAYFASHGRALNVPTVACFAAGALACHFTNVVTVHEWIHESLATGRRPHPVVRLASTLLTGVPFELARAVHAEHHVHGNAPQDPLSTWRDTPWGLKARARLSFCFSAPLCFIGALLRLREVERVRLRTAAPRRSRLVGLVLAQGGPLPGDVQSGPYAGSQVPTFESARCLTEGVALAVALALLGVLSPAVWGFGVPCAIVAGQALSMLQHYAEHPPVRGQVRLALSSVSPLYNILFFNNGLHAEHHGHPEVAWEDLGSAGMARGDAGRPLQDASPARATGAAAVSTLAQIDGAEGQRRMPPLLAAFTPRVRRQPAPARTA